MTLFSLSPILLWFLAGIVFLSLELVLPGLIVFFFGLGAWCTALFLYLLPMTVATQVLIFLGASLLSLVLLRSTLKKVFLGRASEVDAMAVDLPAGAIGEVIEDIQPPAAGKIKFGGSFWQATAEVPLPRGSMVRILEKTNLTAKVGPIEPQGEV